MYLIIIYLSLFHLRVETSRTFFSIGTHIYIIRITVYLLCFVWELTLNSIRLCIGINGTIRIVTIYVCRANILVYYTILWLTITPIICNSWRTLYQADLWPAWFQNKCIDINLSENFSKYFSPNGNFSLFYFYFYFFIVQGFDRSLSICTRVNCSWDDCSVDKW